MRVNGEVFFLMNGCMDFFSLLLAARWGKTPLRMGRAAGAALLGGAYALLSWGVWPLLRGVPALGMAALLMSAAAFGARGAAACPRVLFSLLFLSGLADFLWRRGIPGGGVIVCCGTATLLAARWMDASRLRAEGRITLRVTYRGQSTALRALRDSGNLLRDPVTGLRVIAASLQALRPLIPPGTDPRNLTTLPRGWRLITLRTAAGSKTCMCFHPDRVELLSGGRTRRTDALIALSQEALSRALVPDAFFQGEEADHRAGV